MYPNDTLWLLCVTSFAFPSLYLFKILTRTVLFFLVFKPYITIFVYHNEVNLTAIGEGLVHFNNNMPFIYIKKKTILLPTLHFFQFFVMFTEIGNDSLVYNITYAGYLYANSSN